MNEPFTYLEAFDAADLAMKCSRFKYRPGAQRAAALAAVAQQTQEAAITVMTDVLEEYRIGIDATGWAEAAFPKHLFFIDDLSSAYLYGKRGPVLNG